MPLKRIQNSTNIWDKAYNNELNMKFNWLLYYRK